MPEQSSNVKIVWGDGGTGRTVSQSRGGLVFVGTSTIPTTEPVQIRSKKDLPTLLGKGILTEELEDYLTVVNPSKLYAMSILPDVLLDPSVKSEGSTEESKLPALEGQSQTVWEAKFIIVTAGAPNVATFNWEFNGIEQEEETIPLDKKFEISGTGITLTFKDLYEAGDSFTIYTEGKPKVSDAKMTETIEKVVKARLDVEAIVVTNPLSKIALVGFKTILEKIAEDVKPCYYLGVAPKEGILAQASGIEDYIKTLVEEVKNYRSNRLVVLPFEALVISESAEKVKVPVGLFMARFSSIEISQAPNEVGLGGMSNFLSPYPKDIEDSITLELATAGFVVWQEIFGADGVFPVSPRTTIDEISDYYRFERTRIMNFTSTGLRKTLLPYLNTRIYSRPDGTLDSTSISMIEAKTNQFLDTLVNDGTITKYSVEIDKAQNVVSTGKLEIQVRILPPGYSEFILVDLGFTSSIAA